MHLSDAAFILQYRDLSIRHRHHARNYRLALPVIFSVTDGKRLREDTVGPASAFISVTRLNTHGLASQNTLISILK